MRLRTFPFAKWIFFSLAGFPWMAQGNSLGQWIPGKCNDDGTCSLISIELEVSQKSAPQKGGIVVGSIDDDGFKPLNSDKNSVRKTCRKEVRVPRTVYDAVTQMFNGIAARGADGQPPSNFTPAEQTMLLYYNTIMQQTMNFNCNN